MTINQLIKRAQKLQAKGYGNSQVIFIEDWNVDEKSKIKHRSSI